MSDSAADVDYIEQPLNIESKEARHLCRQCQKCWKRKSAEVKLLVCSSCRITSYCSTQCQRADWKFHKNACMNKRLLREQMAKHDLEQIQKNGAVPDKPLASVIAEEIGHFLRRFRPVICQSGYRCLGVARGNPQAWRQFAFVMRIERLSNPPPESRAWARYKVVRAEAVPFALLLATHGAAMADILKQGDVYHAENVKKECIGTVTTFIECDSAGRDMRFASWGGYGPDVWDEVQPGEDWKETLVNTVEKQCGRLVKT